MSTNEELIAGELNRLIRDTLSKTHLKFDTGKAALVLLKEYMRIHGYELQDSGELKSEGVTIADINMSSIRYEHNTLSYALHPRTPLNYINIEIKI